MNRNPYICSADTVGSIQRETAVALMPAVFVYVALNRLLGLRLLVLGVASAVLFELLFEKIAKRSVTIADGSAWITGTLIVLFLPYDAPWYLPVLASGIAILGIKQFFGGIGRNLFNPAAASLCILAAFRLWNGVETFFDWKTAPVNSLEEMLSRNIHLDVEMGTILFSAAFLLGGIYLLIRRIDDGWKLGGFLPALLLVFLFGYRGVDSPPFVVDQLFGSWTFAGIFFLMADPVTSPSTREGQLAFGFAAGFFTGILRLHGMEGTVLSVLLANLLVPFLEKYSRIRFIIKEMES